MNMIPTGAFLTEMDASEKKETLAEQFVSIWEKKNSKIARAGGVSLMALSLAACGSSSDDTAATDTPAAETPAEETPAAETPAEETPAEEEVVEEVTPVVTELAVAALTADTTMKTTDDLDGGDGTADELSLSLSADFAGFVVDPDAADTGSMVGYETISLAADTLARSFDATGVSGVETYKVDGSNGGVVSIADSADLAAIELSNIASGAFSITYAAPTGGTSPVAGSADTLDLTVEGLGSATADIAITAAGIETLAVTSNAAASAAGATNYLDTSGVSATKMTISGAADTDIGAVKVGTTSFDASAATGAITAALTNASDSGLATVKTGSGDDSVTLDLNDLTATATVALGDGADTLTVSSTATETFQLKMSGAETIDVTDIANGTTATLSLSDSSDLTTVTAGSAAGTNDFGTGTLALVNATGDLAINTAGESGAGTISTDTTGAVTITVADDADSKAITAGGDDASAAIFGADKAGSVTLNVTGNIDQTGNISADKATSVTVTTSAFTQSDIDIDAAKAETVTITSGGTAAYNTSSDFSGAKVLTVDSTKTTTIGNLAALKDATISGDGSKAATTLGNVGASDLAYNIDITATGTKSGLTIGTVDTAGAATIDAGGVTGSTTVGAITSTGAATVTGGAGAVSLGAIDASAITLDFAAGTSTAGVGTLTSGSTVDITANAVTAITGTVGIVGDKTSLTVTATGSLGDDVYSLSNSTAKGFTGFTVSGDFGLGSDTIAIAVTDATAVSTETPSQTIDITGVKSSDVTINVDNTVTATDTLIIKGTKDTDSTDTVTFTNGDAFSEATIDDIGAITFHTTLALNASAVSGDTIAFTGNGAGDTITLNGTAAADTISTANLTAAANADLIIDAGAGSDSITLGAMAEVVSYTSTADGADTISGFTTGTDDYDTDFATTSAIGTHADLAAGAGALTLNTAGAGVIEITGAALRADITDYTSGAQVLAAISDTSVSVSADTNSCLVVLYDNDNAYVYEVTEGADAANTAVAADDITLVATFVDIADGTLAAGDFV